MSPTSEQQRELAIAGADARRAAEATGADPEARERFASATAAMPEARAEEAARQSRGDLAPVSFGLLWTLRAARSAYVCSGKDSGEDGQAFVPMGDELEETALLSLVFRQPLASYLMVTRRGVPALREAARAHAFAVDPATIAADVDHATRAFREYADRSDPEAAADAGAGPGK